MRLLPILFLVVTIPFSACSSRGGAARNPARPTPVAEPGPGSEAVVPPGDHPGSGGTDGLPETRRVPVRPDQAPLVHVRQALEVDTLLGRRVRIAGRCAAAGVGPRA